MQIKILDSLKLCYITVYVITKIYLSPFPLQRPIATSKLKRPPKKQRLLRSQRIQLQYMINSFLQSGIAIAKEIQDMEEEVGFIAGRGKRSQQISQDANTIPDEDQQEQEQVDADPGKLFYSYPVAFNEAPILEQDY